MRLAYDAIARSSVDPRRVLQRGLDPTRGQDRGDSEEGHLSGFRQSPEFHRFFEAVGPYVHDIQEMRHYQVTLSSDA